MNEIQQKIDRLYALKLELETSKLPAMMLVDKFKEAVLLNIEVTKLVYEHAQRHENEVKPEAL